VTPDEIMAFMKREVDKWVPVVRATNIQPQQRELLALQRPRQKLIYLLANRRPETIDASKAVAHHSWMLAWI
jgi:hypothetical protein